jgi:sortase (surface protein transpeptidase)
VTEKSRRPSPRTWLVLALALVVVGATAIVIGVTGQQSAPQPAAGARSTAGETTAGAPESSAAPTVSIPGSGSDPAEAPEPADVAAPVSVAIPSIGVTSDLMRLGLADDGAVQVPPLEADDTAGWYERGPAPGAVGPAVLLGHVDSAEYGPGVFFDLGAVVAGDAVDVTRADGSVATFVVDRVEVHPKDEFPTIDVYGNTDDAQLRLITCGGDFDASARSYEDNVIVFATLTGTRAA